MTYEIPRLPGSGFYHVKAESRGYIDDVRMICELCPEGTQSHYYSEFPDTPEKYKAADEWVHRHQAKAHPEKTFVLTSGGWVRAENLSVTDKRIRADLTENALASLRHR